MEVSIEQTISQIVEYGIPDPWQKFGMLLSQDGAASTAIVQAISRFRQNKSATALAEVQLLFQKKLENLQAARFLLGQVIQDYDQEGTWEKLDEAIKAVDINEALQLLYDDFGLHPFPIILKSLEFNWGYMQRNGTREFYVMTDRYLAEIKKLTQDALESFQQEVENGVIKPYWLIRMDLMSIETPTHCDACRVTIAVLMAARGQLEYLNSFAVGQRYQRIGEKVLSR